MPQAPADFRLGGDESVGCRMSIEGEIVTGDAERFRDMLVAYIETVVPKDRDRRITPPFSNDYPHEIRICLDSPGGSFAEAMEMADTLAYAYRVQSDIAPRVPGPRGRHRLDDRQPPCPPVPAARVPARSCSWRAGISRTWAHPTMSAIPTGCCMWTAGWCSGCPAPTRFATLQRIGARLDRYIVPPSLFQRIMAASPDGMVPVDTVEQAASWVIQLAGAPLIADPSLGNLGRVCATISALSQPGMPLGAPSIRWQRRSPAENPRPRIHARCSALQPQIGVARSQGTTVALGKDQPGKERDGPAYGTIRARLNVRVQLPRPIRCRYRRIDPVLSRHRRRITGVVRGAIPALGPRAGSGGWNAVSRLHAPLQRLFGAGPCPPGTGPAFRGTRLDGSGHRTPGCAGGARLRTAKRSAGGGPDTCEGDAVGADQAGRSSRANQENALWSAWRMGQAPALPSGLEGTEEGSGWATRQHLRHGGGPGVVLDCER